MKSWGHLLLAAMAGAGLSLAPSAPAAATAPVWQVDWGDQFCTLVRLPDAATHFVVAFRVIPGAAQPSIVLTHGGPDPAPNDIDAIELGPANLTFRVRAQSEERQNGSVTVLYGLHDDFWNALGNATELRLRAGRGRRVIALSRTAPAVAALRQCEARVMREWGVDQAALASLRRRPESTNMYGLSDYDYPDSAVRESRQGRVVVRVDVSAEGRATACTVVGPSGSEALDTTTCRVILASARFRPAIGADGRPTAARIVNAVMWLMPSN